eukprot:CAMPEP_0119343654 /NCGR_PEP_ID=MMETSP1333-20130426/106562_1 /TAXON_ID=418940 /ORGANISM="Scyphosphaera apsteinii, Strain RCC1455" /LENGTH=525 /DNA_ID=CAMNT_0007356057 /DNA_START=81 /DNA_END=1658 /DNA_ORIENTATION=+
MPLLPLIEQTEDGFLEVVLLPKLALLMKRVLACVCSNLRFRLSALFRASTLSVLRCDAIWSNVLFVASLRNLQVLSVEGEGVLELGRLRKLPRLKVTPELGRLSALFLGGTIAAGNLVLRLSDGVTTRNLEALAQALQPPALLQLSDVDIAAMIGTWAARIHRLQEYPSNAPSCDAPEIQQAFVDALPMQAHIGAMIQCARQSGPPLPIFRRFPRGIMLAALNQERSFKLLSKRYILSYAADEPWNDRDFVLEALQHDGHALLHASAEMQGAREVVLAAVQNNGCALEHASTELRGDRGVVLAAVQQAGHAALKYASVELWGDYEVVLAAVQKNGCALEHASKELRGNRGVVLAAVQQAGHAALKYASVELIGDREFVLAAVQQDSRVLKFAAVELRCDRNVVLAAVHQNGHALEYATEELRGDRELILAAVKSNGKALMWASDELRGDREVVLLAKEHNPIAIEYASDEFPWRQYWPELAPDPKRYSNRKAPKSAEHALSQLLLEYTKKSRRIRNGRQAPDRLP